MLRFIPLAYRISFTESPNLGLYGNWSKRDPFTLCYVHRITTNYQIPLNYKDDTFHSFVLRISKHQQMNSANGKAPGTKRHLPTL